ncbi:hypothetical protein J4437_02685 [Candidatus Woesearchaeota archaeon]|nr:hypothetical protein [Candidatus Woesearchaeota archaeon]
MNWKKKAILGTAASALGTAGVLAWQISQQAPDPILLKKDTAFRLGALTEEYFERFQDHFSTELIDNTLLKVRLTQGDRILVYGENGEDTSYFVEGKKEQTHDIASLESIIAQKIGQAAVKLDLIRTQEIEIVPMQDFFIAPKSYNELLTRLEYGWKHFQLNRKQQVLSQQKSTKQPADLFLDPGIIHEVSKHINYPYGFSPAVEGVEYEYSYLQDFDKQRILWFFDNISNTTARKLMKAANSDNLEETLNRYKSTIEGKGEIIKAVASSLREAKIIYHEEGLWNKAFDPKLHRGDFFHLDCDLLVYTFLHVASRLDLPLYAVHAPNHLYLKWRDIEHNFAIEATEFRNKEVQGDYINMAGKNLGKDFFPSDNYLRGKYIVDKNFQDHARFFETLPEVDLHSTLKVGIISSLYKQATQKYKEDNGLEQMVLNEMEILSQKTDNTQLHTNLYIINVNKAKKAFNEKAYEKAKVMIDKALGILEHQGDKVVRNTKGENYELRARISKKLGKDSNALADYRHAVQWYELRGAKNMTQGAIKDEAHARARFYVGKDLYKKGDLTTAYNQYLGFTVNFLLNNEPEDKQLYEAFRLAANIFKWQDQETFQSMDLLAREHGL